MFDFGLVEPLFEYHVNVVKPSGIIRNVRLFELTFKRTYGFLRRIYDELGNPVQ